MHSNITGGKNSTKSLGQSNPGGGSNNVHVKCKSNIAIIYKKVSNQKRHLSVFNTAANSGSDDEELDGLDKEYGSSDHSALTRQGKYKRSKKA